MKVTINKITVENPAAYLLNRYRTAVTNHINGALDTIIANNGNHPAVMATLDQMYEDAQQLRMMGLINDREYDAIAAIAFDVVCGDNETHLLLPEIHTVRDAQGEYLYTITDAKQIVREGIASPINRCLRFLTNSNAEEWKQDGWENEEEYHKCIFKTIHNIMRLGKIIGATTEKDHDYVTQRLMQCVDTKELHEVVFGD